MDIAKLQAEVGKWTRRNFGDAPSYLALLKAMEELGETAGSYIARVEKRVGKTHTPDSIEDGIADTIIALCVFCERENIDLDKAVRQTWEVVSQRTFEGQEN